MLFLTKNKLIQKLDNDIIFSDINTTKISKEMYMYSKQVFHVPVLKIILDDDVATHQSQRMFYSDSDDVQYTSIEQFKCKENEDAYFILNGVRNSDFLSYAHSHCENDSKKKFISDIYFQIKNVLSKL
jgi:hypothetical protein